jgi:hypothetical protein
MSRENESIDIDFTLEIELFQLYFWRRVIAHISGELKIVPMASKT